MDPFPQDPFPQCQAGHALGRRVVPALLAVTQRRVLPAGGAKPLGTHPLEFSGLSTLGVGATHYFCASPAYLAYASTRLLPDAPQGSAPGSALGSRRTITQTGLAPARMSGLSRPHSPLFPIHNTVDLVYFWCESLMGGYPASHNRRRPEHLSCLHLGNRAIGLWPGKWR